MANIEILQCECRSETLRNSRTVWVQRPSSAEIAGVCVFLDGEYYIAQLRAAAIVDRLQRQESMPPFLVAYVSHIDFDIRWPESFCNPNFALFLSGELVPWLVAEFEVSRHCETAIVGLSLTGLSAAHAALQHPGAFNRVLCQSGSFWWNESWLPSNLDEHPNSNAVFRVSVGSSETTEEVDHGKGLIQSESQLASNRRMRDALIAKGHRVSYHEFDGAHDVPSWRNDLPGSLTSLFEL